MLVVGSQMGKSETLLDVIGERLDTSPVPILYLGPTKQFLNEQFEPRIQELLDQAPTLAGKVGRGKKSTKTKKIIAGVSLRLAHGGSSVALKSDPFGLVVTDEADELLANVKGAGNPVELADVRGDTYADFVHAVTSTPSEGPSEVRLDEESGLEFWADVEQEEVNSVIWKLWLSGTRHHWAWPCPHCGEYFIPRFRCLSWDKPKDASGKELRSTPTEAARTAHLVCPRNGCIIHDTEIRPGTNQTNKEWMNSRADFVAPGQKIDPDGEVTGNPPDSWTLSYWVSGLCSPFQTWGQRAARYVQAVRSGDHQVIKTVMNAGFGELYVPGDGEVPEWSEVYALGEQYERGYRLGTCPVGVQIVTMTVDVQTDRLIYVKRGWGAYAESWLLEAGELFGDTSDTHIWNQLYEVIQDRIGGFVPKLVLVDSGFRPGKKAAVPEHRVYEFARRFPHLVRATKGSSTPMRKPILASKIDVKIDGREFKKGLNLLRLDPDHFKSEVHAKVRWPADLPGSWHLPMDISEDYCMQIVSESRAKTPNGRVRWVQRSKENHFLDCEAMQLAAAMALNLRALRARGSSRRKPQPEPTPSEAEATTIRLIDGVPAVDGKVVFDKPNPKAAKPRKPLLQRERYW